MKPLRFVVSKLCVPTIVLIFLSFSYISHAQSQPWSGILSSSRGVNWQNAGAVIPTTRTQCGSTVPAGTSASTINSDLSACASGTYLLLGSGTFSLSQGLNLPSNVTLRGSGSNSTFLTFSAGVSCRGGAVNICAASADTNYWGGPSNSASWTSGYAAGTTSITLNSISGSVPKVGQPIILDQIDSQSDNGALYVGCEIGGSSGDTSSTCYSGAGPNGFERGLSKVSTIRGQQQIVQVTSVSGSGSGPYTVGITPGIYAGNWASGNSPGAWWAKSPVQNIGIESLSIDNTGDKDQGILLFNCQNCWVKGVRSIVTSGGLQTGWYHVGMWMCNHCTVRDSYFFGNTGDAYGASVGVASDILVENNIMQYPSYFQLYNSDCEGCVSGYNFAVSTLFQTGGTNWLQQPSDFHGVVLYSLAEGNIGAGNYSDSFHGSHDLDTFFRNRLDGNEQNAGTATTSNTLPIIMNPATRYYNIVANILGTPGYHTTYKCGSACTKYDTSIYDAGNYTGIYDPLTDSTALYWGNWDTATNNTRWCGSSTNTRWSTTCSSASEVPTNAIGYPNTVPTVGDTGAGQSALPPSFYYSSQPSWWPSGKSWPIIGPDVTGGNVGQCSGGTNAKNEVVSAQSAQCTSSGGTFSALSMVISNPAMDCYFNSMSGQANGTEGALAFDANACYGNATSQTQPSAPTSIAGQVSPAPQN